MPELIQGTVVLGFDPLIIKGEKGDPGGGSGDPQSNLATTAYTDTQLAAERTRANSTYLFAPTTPAAGVLTRAQDGTIGWQTSTFVVSRDADSRAAVAVATAAITRDPNSKAPIITGS